MLRDLPWLFDSEATPQQTRLNWKETYRLMREISRSDCPERNPQVANRRRVWETCEQIASVYWAKHAGRKSLGKTPKPTLAGKIETRSLPACADFGTRHTAKENVFELQAIAQWTDIGKYPLHIESLWNPKGHLASLSTEIQYEGSTTWRQDMINSSALPEGSERQTVTVPPAKWISSITVVIGKCGNCRAVVGLIFTLLPEGTLIVGSMTGEKRLLEVANGNVFVGFQGELAEDLVVRLGISEGKPAEAAPYLASFIAEPKAGNVALLKYLWANEIPPRQLVPTKPHFGYWAADANRSEMVTMDALVIGTTEEELKGVTGISADALSWGFVVHYSDRPSRKVGQRHHAMKHFAISGFEGERVVGMTASSGALLDDVCLMTNWGRQCVFGRAPCSTAIVLQSGSFETQQVPEAGHFFAGFFGSWMYRENAMICCAKLSCPMENKTGPAPEPRSWTLDEGGRFLDTHLVPSHWKPSGPMYGNNPENTLADTGGNNKMPTDAGIASILDCSKPIDNIEVWFTHPQRLVIPLNQRRNNPNLTVAQCAEVQFVSIVLRLSNGSTVAVGPSEFDEMYKHPKVYEPLCNCAVYYEGHPLGPKKLEKKLPFKLHYHGEQWRIGGQKLAALRVWSSVFLDGLQFVACDGHVSPPFGLCEGDPSGVVQFGGWRAVSTERTASNCSDLTWLRQVGLKILSDTNSRPVTKQDVVLLGLQAMNLG